MAKRMSREEKRQQALIDIINQMFIIAGHSVTYNDVIDRKDAWYQDWTMTVAQNEEWKQWGVAYLRKNLRVNKALAEREMQWSSLMWGLKFSDPENIGKDNA
jgi:hypothetical protein